MNRNHLASWLFWVLPFAAFGQEYIHSVQHFSVEDGLSHRNVYDVVEDNDGFLWIATEYGLNRFDGTVFQLQEIDHPHFPQQLFKDPQGFLWVCRFNTKSEEAFRKLPIIHFETQISILDPVSGTFKAFESFFLNAPISSSDIVGITQKAGHLWIETQAGAWFTYDGKFKMEFDPKNMYPPPVFIQPTSKGTFWVWQKGKVSEVTAEGVVFFSQKMEDEPNFIAVNATGDVTLGAFKNADTTGSMYRLRGKKFVHLTDLPKMPATQRYLSLLYKGNSILDRRGLHWVSSVNFLGVFDRDGMQLIDFTLLILENDKAARIQNTYLDRQNNVWVSTSKGIFHLSLRKNPFQAYFSERGKTVSFRGIAEGDNGNMYFGCYAGAKQLLLPSGKEAPWELPEPDNTLGVFKDDDGSLWTGTHNPFVQCYNPATKTTKELHLDKEETFIACIALYRDSRRRLWVGMEGGLGYVDTAIQKVVTLHRRYPDLGYEVAINFFHENQEGLWMASSKGLFLLNLETDSLTQFSKLTGHLPYDDLMHIHEDKDGIFWLSTRGGGLVSWNRKTGVSEQFTLQDGLSNLFVHAAYEDAAGTLWLPSDFGLMRFYKANKKVDAYFVRHGLPSNEFNRYSHFRSKDGRIWLGTTNGVAAFSPDEIQPEEAVKPQFHLTELEILNGKSGKWENRLAGFTGKNSITLQPSDKSISIRLALLDFVNPSENRYSYFFEGLDVRPIFLPTNSLRLSSLPYGDYKLVLEAQGAAGPWSGNRLEILVTALRPFYATWQFRLAVLLGIAACIVAFFRYRTRQLRRQKERLEKEVARRSEEILQKNRKLEEVNATKDHLFSIISHDLRDHALSFLGIAQKVNYLLKKKQPERLLPLGDHIEQSAQNLEVLLDNLLNWSLSQRQGLVYNPKEVNLLKAVNSVLENYSHKIESKNIRVELCVSKSLSVLADRSSVGILLQNLVSNALKFSKENGLLQIWAEPEGEEKVLVAIQDYGIGIPKGKLKTLLEVLRNQSTKGTSGESGTGLGMVICKSLMELNRGQIRVESEEGLGTKVELLFPAVKK